MSIMDKKMRITMPDGSRWDVPISVIARDRAAYYSEEYADCTEMSLKEDTIPLFEESEYDIKDWAANNMDWSDVVEHASQVAISPPVDFQEGWVNGEKEIVD